VVSTTTQEVFTLSREEIYYLMGLLGADSMIGLGAAESEPAILDHGRASLLQRGLMTTGATRSTDEVDARLLPLTMTSFFPDAALFIVRDVPEIGKQILLIFRRGSLTVLHTFPEQFSHRLAPLASPAQAVDLIQRWFPLTAYPDSEGSLTMTVQSFGEFRDKAEAYHERAALQAIADCPLVDAEKVNLAQAIAHCTISGSFAVMHCDQNVITAAHSLAVFAGPSTAWLISYTDDDTQGHQLLIRRIGADFENVVTGMVQRM